MTAINYVALSAIPEMLNKRMVILKPTRGYQGRPVHNWDEAIRNTVTFFWMLGADCNSTYEAVALLDGKPYNAVVEIAPDGRFMVRRI